MRPYCKLFLINSKTYEKIRMVGVTTQDLAESWVGNDEGRMISYVHPEDDEFKVIDFMFKGMFGLKQFVF